MNNEDTQFENLENLTQEELDALDTEETTETNEDKPSEPTIEEFKTRAEQAERRAATLQRLLNKKGEKTINKTTNPNLEKDIQEIKHLNKVMRFAEDNGLTKAQAEKVLSIHPNADAETLKDPFIAEGIKALARKERLAANTPNGKGVNSSTVSSKPYNEMTAAEKDAWYQKAFQK